MMIEISHTTTHSVIDRCCCDSFELANEGSGCQPFSSPCWATCFVTLRLCCGLMQHAVALTQLFWQVIKVQEVIKEVAVDREVCALAQPFNPLFSL